MLKTNSSRAALYLILHVKVAVALCVLEASLQGACDAFCEVQYSQLGGLGVYELLTWSHLLIRPLSLLFESVLRKNAHFHLRCLLWAIEQH